MNVYDFDNTIYDGESSIDFFLYYIKKDPSLLKYVPKVMSALAKYKAGKITIESALSEYGEIVTNYIKTMDNPESDVKDFWDKHQHKIKAFYNDVRKDNDVIITTSPAFLIDEIASRLNIMNYICTDIDINTGKINHLCYRENKLNAFKEKYGNLMINDFYTDSMNDKPLMDISSNVYFVTKDRIEKIK